MNDSYLPALHVYKGCQILSFLYSTRAIPTAPNSAYLVIDPKKNLQDHFNAPPCPPPPPIKSSSLVGETSRKDKVATPTPPKKPPRFRIGASGGVVENVEGSGYDNDETSSMLLPIKPHSKTVPVEYKEPSSKKTFKLPFIKRLKTTSREPPNFEEEELVYDDIINALNTLPLSKTTPTEVPMTTPQLENVSAVSEKEKKKKKLPMTPPPSNTTQRPPPESYQNLYTPTEFPGTTFEDVSVNSKGMGPPYYEFEIGPSALSPPPEPPCSETTPTEVPPPSKSFFKLPSIKLLRSKTTPREPTEKYENVEKEPAVYSNTTSTGPAVPSRDGSGSSKKAAYYEFEIGPSAFPPPPCSETTPTEHEASSRPFFKLPSIKLLRSKTTPTEKDENVDEKKKEVGDKLPTYSNTKPPSGDASKDSKKPEYYEFEVGPSALLPPTQPPCSETTPTEVPPSKSFFKLPKLFRSKSTSKEPTEKYENVNAEVVPSTKKLPKVPPKTTPPSGVDSKKGEVPMYDEIDFGPAALPTPIPLLYHNLPLTDGPGTTLTPPVVPRNKDKKKQPPKTPDTSLTDVSEAPPTTADTSVKKKETKKKKPKTPLCPKDPPTEAPGTNGSKDTPMYHEIDIHPTATPAPIQQYVSSQTTITDGPDTRRTYASVKKTNKKPKTPPRPITPLREISRSETLTSVDAPVKEKPKILPRPTTPLTVVSEDTSTSAVTKKKSKTLPHHKATPTEVPETTPTSVGMKEKKKGKPMTPPRPKNLTMPRDMGVVSQEEEDIYDDVLFQ